MRIKFYFIKNKLTLTSQKKNIVLVFLLGVSATTLSQQIAKSEIGKSGDISDNLQFKTGKIKKEMYQLLMVSF